MLWPVSGRGSSKVYVPGRYNALASWSLADIRKTRIMLVGGWVGVNYASWKDLKMG